MDQLEQFLFLYPVKMYGHRAISHLNLTLYEYKINLIPYKIQIYLIKTL